MAAIDYKANYYALLTAIFTDYTVNRALKTFCLLRPYRANAIDAERVAQMHSRGLSQREIAHRIGCSRTAVFNYLRNNKLNDCAICPEQSRLIPKEAVN